MKKVRVSGLFQSFCFHNLISFDAFFIEFWKLELQFNVYNVYIGMYI